MKVAVTAFLLCCLVASGWSCSSPDVKTGSTPGNTQDDAQSTDEAVSSSVDASGSGGAEAETETVVLNIDEKKEADSIYTVIETLEDCYRTENYELWLSLLTRAYKDHFDDPETLDSEGWDAQNIQEFFNLLVNTRRRGNIADLEISRVEFVSDYKAYVYVILGDKEFPEPQHTFIRIGETWYKGLSTEEV
jgi:hypothetical protein